jgi:membrane associated rhomboid family serine protease
MTEAPESQQNQQPTPRERAINLPGSVLALIGVLVAIHLARVLVLNEQTDEQLAIWVAFIPLRIAAGQQDPSVWLPLIWTPFTYALLHAGWMHLIINCVWLAAFGTPIAQRYGAWQMLAVFFISSAAGAALFAVFPSGGALIGASGGIAGLTGAACRFIFQPLIIHRDPETGEQRVLGRKLASFGELLRDRRAGVFILVWLGGNAVVPLIPDLFGGVGTISWQAHLGGFLAGLLLVPLFERKPKEQHHEH